MCNQAYLFFKGMVQPWESFIHGSQKRAEKIKIDSVQILSVSEIGKLFFSKFHCISAWAQSRKLPFKIMTRNIYVTQDIQDRKVA